VYSTDVWISHFHPFLNLSEKVAFLSDFTMKFCVVCNNKRGLFVCPKDERVLLHWKRILSINTLSSSDRICQDHFLDSDMMQTPKEYHKIKRGAVPSKNLQTPSTSSSRSMGSLQPSPLPTFLIEPYVAQAAQECAAPIIPTLLPITTGSQQTNVR